MKGLMEMTKVLIVDDAKFMRLALSSIFNKNNIEIVGLAENGQEAVQMFEELKPDIVMLDIIMPVMNGIEALKEIIEIDHNAKVVMCSAMGQQKQVVEAIEQGAMDFIVKPFNEDKILKTVHHILNNPLVEEKSKDDNQKILND